MDPSIAYQNINAKHEGITVKCPVTYIWQYLKPNIINIIKYMT